jgi:Zn-dependent protease
MAESPLQKLRRLEAEERARREAEASGNVAPMPEGTAPHPSDSRGKRGGVIGACIAAVLAIVTKGKFAALLLLTKGKLLLGAFKLGPLLTTFSTMGVSMYIYSWYFGWPLAAGFVLLVLLHEWGHGFCARVMGLRVSAPVFIPFFGAFIALREQPQTTWIECVVGFGGPLFGLLGGAGVLIYGMNLPEGHWRDFCMVLSWITFNINLFNLVPVWGLDGDRISQPFRPWFWLPGLGIVLLLASWSVDATGFVNPFLLFILVLGAVKGGTRWWRERAVAKGAAAQGRAVDRLAGNPEDRYKAEAAVEPWRRWASAAMYFGIVAALFAAMMLADGLRPAHQSLSGSGG